jgi:hypothetical protein
MTAARTRAALEAAVEQYRRAHWGHRGPLPGLRSLHAADPRLTLVELGELVRVVYRTKKGPKGKETDYHHDFDEERPVLSYEPRSSLLVILGGKYHVEERGIVG